MDDEAIFWERVTAMPSLEAEQELMLRRERYAVEQQELTLARAAAERRHDHTTHAALGRQMFVLAQQAVQVNERIKYLRRFGTGWFKWLSLFRAPRIRRSLSLEFSEEVGPEKGSWKGGTLGHGIDMLPDETPEAAFRRYCEQEHRSKYQRFRLTFVGHVEQKAA